MMFLLYHLTVIAATESRPCPAGLLVKEIVKEFLFYLIRHTLAVIRQS